MIDSGCSKTRGLISTPIATHDHMMKPQSVVSLAATLRTRVSGEVYEPTDARYASEVAAFNTSVLHKPHVVVAVTSANDVAEVVRIARDSRVKVSVQATGHGAIAPLDGGILISTRALQGVSVDPRSRVATIAGGSPFAPVVTAAAEHGLAPIGGSSITVGVVGYLLGGGLGPLARSHGFSSDYIRGLTVVTGTGEVVEADADRHADLFWALRGGKSGLGIVTSLRLELAELRALYGGSIYFDEPHIEQALRGWVDWTVTSDPRMTTSIAIIKFPPLDVIPAPLRGRRLLALRVAYPNDVKEGARLAEPLRALAPIHLDGAAELPATQIARVHNDPAQPTPSWVRGMLLTHVDQDFASVFLRNFGTGTDSPFIAAEVRHVEGATRQDVPEGSAVGGRGAAFTFGLVGANPALFEKMPAAHARIVEEVRPWTAAETNINFMVRPSSPAQLATAWPAETFARLAEVRRRYDPDGVFNPNAGY
jgi:FAD/FMN-containing dehydrogenase